MSAVVFVGDRASLAVGVSLSSSLSFLELAQAAEESGDE